MKKELFLHLIRKLSQAGNLKHDREGHLYAYDGSIGIWKRLGAGYKERRHLRQVLSDMGENTDATATDTLVREIKESPDFEESRLNGPGVSEFIVCKNGRLNLRSQKLDQCKREAYDRIYLDFEYSAPKKIVPESDLGKYLKTSLGIIDLDPAKNPKLRRFLQIIGYSLSNLFGAKKAAIFLGPPNSGKSLILKLLGEVIGEEHWRPLAFQDLTDKFRCGQLEGAHLILSHEVKFSALMRLDTLKSIISGDSITIEAKGVQPWSYTPCTRLIMAANALPALGEADAGGAFADRLLILPFAAREGDNDPSLFDKLYKERDTLLSMAFSEMSSFIKDGLHFAEDKEGEHILDEYRLTSNNVAAFMNERYTKASGNRVSTKTAYDEYIRYCEDNVLVPCALRQFKPQLEQMGYIVRKSRVDKIQNPISCIIDIRPNGNANTSDGSM